MRAWTPRRVQRPRCSVLSVKCRCTVTGRRNNKRAGEGGASRWTGGGGKREGGARRTARRLEIASPLPPTQLRLRRRPQTKRGARRWSHPGRLGRAAPSSLRSAGLSPRGGGPRHLSPPGRSKRGRLPALQPGPGSGPASQCRRGPGSRPAGRAPRAPPPGGWRGSSSPLRCGTTPRPAGPWSSSPAGASAGTPTGRGTGTRWDRPARRWPSPATATGRSPAGNARWCRGRAARRRAWPRKRAGATSPSASRPSCSTRRWGASSGSARTLCCS